MVQGTPPGSPGAPGQYPPSSQARLPERPEISGEHGFAPPKAALPPAVSKVRRGPMFGALVAAGALAFTIAVASGGFVAYKHYAGAPEEPPKSLGTKLPEWVPVFPSATVLESQLLSRGSGRVDGTVTLLAQEPLQNALNFYRVASKRKGLTLTALTSSPEKFSIEAKSQDGAEKLVVNGSRESQVTELVLLLSTRHSDKTKPVPGDELPAYLELVPGAQVTGQVTRSAKSKVHGVVKFVSTKPAAELLGFYESRLKEAGFDVTRSATLVSAEKNSIDVAKVIVVEEGGKRRVSLIAKAD